MAVAVFAAGRLAHRLSDSRSGVMRATFCRPCRSVPTAPSVASGLMIAASSFRCSPLRPPPSYSAMNWGV